MIAASPGGSRAIRGMLSGATGRSHTFVRNADHTPGAGPRHFGGSGVFRQLDVKRVRKSAPGAVVFGKLHQLGDFAEIA